LSYCSPLKREKARRVYSAFWDGALTLCLLLLVVASPVILLILMGLLMLLVDIV
jgi:hypothetical protein